VWNIRIKWTALCKIKSEFQQTKAIIIPLWLIYWKIYLPWTQRCSNFTWLTHSRQMINLFLYFIKHHTMKAQEGVVVYCHVFLISVLDGQEWSVLHPSCFISKARLPNELGWVPEPVWILWRREISLPLPHIKPWSSTFFMAILSTLQQATTTSNAQSVQHYLTGDDNHSLTREKIWIPQLSIEIMRHPQNYCNMNFYFQNL
jgi:hypothetical protein